MVLYWNFVIHSTAREVKKSVTNKELAEFLRLMKQSEYSVVEQLHRTPIRISLLSLVLSSEPHRKALLKVLNEAYLLMMSPLRNSEIRLGRSRPLTMLLLLMMRSTQREQGMPQLSWAIVF